MLHIPAHVNSLLILLQVEQVVHPSLVVLLREGGGGRGEGGKKGGRDGWRGKGGRGKGGRDGWMEGGGGRPAGREGGRRERSSMPPSPSHSTMLDIIHRQLSLQARNTTAPRQLTLVTLFSTLLYFPASMSCSICSGRGYSGSDRSAASS